MFTRAGMAVNAGNKLASASTITARWSAVRLQGFKALTGEISYKSDEA